MAGPEHTISVIIPCWRDADAAAELASKWKWHPALVEIILAGVEGNEPRQWPVSEKLKWCAAAKPSRGRQMNVGASVAKGDVLLFHHVDSQLTPEHVDAVAQVMRDPAVIGGGFYRAFDERHPALRWLEGIERAHCRAFGTIYGDQSVFVRGEIFRCLGGFAPIPLMEDVEFSKRLRRAGKVALLDPPMRSSPARQIAHGSWRVTLRNLLFLAAYSAGISPHRLHTWYYGKQPARSSVMESGKRVFALE